MKKTFLYPLSILAFWGSILFFESCASLGINSITTPNTKVLIQSERLSSIKLNQKKVLIASFDSLAARDLVISLKNYMDSELTSCQVITKRINIRENEAQDIADFEKLKTEFQPDYILRIDVNVKRTRDFYLIGDIVKKIRDIDFYLKLSSYSATTEPSEVWHGEVKIKHLYDEGHAATMKKSASQLRQKMQKDLIINQ